MQRVRSPSGGWAGHTSLHAGTFGDLRFHIIFKEGGLPCLTLNGLLDPPVCLSRFLRLLSPGPLLTAFSDGGPIPRRTSQGQHGWLGGLRGPGRGAFPKASASGPQDALAGLAVHRGIHRRAGAWLLGLWQRQEPEPPRLCCLPSGPQQPA